jgi:hypothetical protein
MVPPIMMCEIGHNICSACRPKLSDCPRCKGKITNTKNLSLGVLVTKGYYRCIYRKSGCEEVHPVGTIAEHESKCPLGPIRCPYHTLLNEDCDWVGSVKEVESHITSKHTQSQHKVKGTRMSNIGPDGCLKKFPVTLPYETLASNAKCEHLRAQSRLFFFVCTVRNDFLYACVTYVGHRTDACKYEYSVKIEKQSAESDPQWLATYSCLENLEDLICKGNCAAFHCDLARECLDANKALKLTVQIKWLKDTGVKPSPI